MKNLKLLYKQEFQIINNCSHFTVDSEASSRYVASNNKVAGYSKTNLEKCFDIDLSTFDLTPEPADIEIVEIQFMCGEEQLCIALKHGDVILCGTTDQNVECVGSLDSQIEFMSWSPDQEVVLFATNRGTVVAMTHDFDPISELEICSDKFGEGDFVDVGWGSKETQFQGSKRKYVPGQKAHLGAENPLDDDQKVRIVWRGDGQYFAVSNVENSQRKFRVWNRNCELQYTSELMSGMESCFAWKPSGSLIASSQRKVHRHDIVFFELNGLQHGEFTLPFECKQVYINKLEWNCDSTILMLLATDLSTQQMHLQLWCVSNYNWSLKHSIELIHHVSWVSWDLEQPYNLHVLFKKGTYALYKWAWCINCSQVASWALSRVSSDDSSLVAVTDGNRVKVTPFKYMTVPPPLCAYQFQFQENIKQICFSENATTPNTFGVLTNSGTFFCFGDTTTTFESNLVDLQLMALGGNGFKSQLTPVSVFAVFRPDPESCPLCPNWWCNLRHLVWCTSELLFGVTTSSENKDCIVALNLNEKAMLMSCTRLCTVDSYVICMCSDSSGESDPGVVVQLDDGKILKQNTSFQKPFLNSVGEEVCFNTVCPAMQLCGFMNTDDNVIVYAILALSLAKRLYLNKNIISNECTSFALHSDYIIFSTSSHTLVFISRDTKVLDVERQPSNNSRLIVDNQKNVMSRPVERGSQLVIVTPGDTKTLLQLPRGNLEQIHPRPLVISVVKDFLTQGQYNQAFTLMRKHRINLNLFYDHNPSQFLRDVALLIQELDSVDYINLFLSDIREEDVTETMYKQFYLPTSEKPTTSLLTTKESKVDKICDAVMLELLRLDSIKYFLSILTAHIRKSKPEIEQALTRLQTMKKSDLADEKLINDALRHLHVLVDARVLYMEALATYDLQLAMAVAQVSNNDPKEYIPFLNELKSLDENFKRYKIDMHLKKYLRALNNISKCPDYFSDCLELILSHGLHREALRIFQKYTPQYREISNQYAEVLIASHDYEEAGIMLSRCDNHRRAIKCFVKAGCWEHALNSASHLNYPEQEYAECAKTLSETLLARNRHLEAATVLEEAAKDSESAITVLCKGQFWSRALRLIRIHKLHDFTDTHLIPALIQSTNDVTSIIGSYREQYDKHYTRLLKVREIKRQKQLQNALTGEGDGDLDSDIASDFGSTVTASSRSSLNSRTSHRTSKSKRKSERKRFSLREGSRFEEEGLLQALREVIVKFSTLKDGVHSLIIHLTLFHMDNEAKSLQNLYDSTHKLFVQTKSKVWVLPDVSSIGTMGAQSTVNSIIAARNGLGNNSLSFADMELAIPPKIDEKLTCGMHLHSI